MCRPSISSLTSCSWFGSSPRVFTVSPSHLHFASLLTRQVACYYLLGVSAAVTPILMPFINMALRDDAEARAVTVGGMLTAGWAVFSFYPIAVFPVVEAPRWTKGYAVNICFVVGCWACFSIMQYLYKRSERKREEIYEGATVRDEEDILSDKKPGNGVTEHVEERR